MDLSSLKNLLQTTSDRANKILLVLGTFEKPCAIKDIKIRSHEAGLKIPKNWNLSSLLARTAGLAINTPNGWELTAKGKQHLISLGAKSATPEVHQIATNARKELIRVSDQQTRDFVEEAIQCFEAGFHRSAVIMSWLAAIHILQLNVVQNHLSAFNREAAAKHKGWRTAKTSDDLGQIKETEFLDRLVNIGVLQKNISKELKNCLDRRNACGHPNSYQLGQSTVSHHLEILLLNVFTRF